MLKGRICQKTIHAPILTCFETDSCAMVGSTENAYRKYQNLFKVLQKHISVVLGGVDSGHLFENKRAAMTKKLLEKAPSYTFKVSWE